MPLLDVKEESGLILHIVEEAAWKAACRGEAESVSCCVDLERRRDFAQQHTGEHILAACLKKATGVEAVSVHFGDEYSTIETLAENISAEELLAAEAAANAVLAEGKTVSCHWIDSAAMGSYPLRRTPDVTGRVHIVEVGDADICACCGVHLPDTSSLGLILITGTERIRGRVRLAFITGGRVVRAFHAMNGVLESLRGKLSCGDADLLRAVGSLLEEKAGLGRRLGEARAELFRRQAAEMAKSAVESISAPGCRARFMSTFLEDASPQELSGFTACLLETGPALTVVGAVAAGRVSWVVAHNLGGAGPDLRQLLPQRVAMRGGKGGGQAERFQGSFPDAASCRAFAEDVRKYFFEQGETHAV